MKMMGLRRIPFSSSTSSSSSSSPPWWTQTPSSSSSSTSTSTSVFRRPLSCYTRSCISSSVMFRQSLWDTRCITPLLSSSSSSSSSSLSPSSWSSVSLSSSVLHHRHRPADLLITPRASFASSSSSSKNSSLLSSSSSSSLSKSKNKLLSDNEILSLVEQGKLAPHKLESFLLDQKKVQEGGGEGEGEDPLLRAVKLRRTLLERSLASSSSSLSPTLSSSSSSSSSPSQSSSSSTSTSSSSSSLSSLSASIFDGLPLENFDYNQILGVSAENVVGYVTIPVGIAGPVLIDGKPFAVPLATTEGCLIASTHRGCKAINEAMGGRGAVTTLVDDGMTRAPLIKVSSASRGLEIKKWIQQEKNYERLKKAFLSSSRFALLQSIDVTQAGLHLFLRFKATSGDAMGMNMITIGSEKAMTVLKEEFPDIDLLSLSGNLCTDKKPSAVNWINGRGKSVISEVVLPEKIVQEVLKTSIDSMVQTNISKNLVGSAMAGSVGGFNAHASNIVTALFIATGQDPAQNVESSNCITLMEPVQTENGRALHISVTMPSLEVATVGGGTQLSAQSACLNILGLKGPSMTRPGTNSEQLARVVATAVLAGEMSLMAALTAGHLVRSHLALNRRKEEEPKEEKKTKGRSGRSSGRKKKVREQEQEQEQEGNCMADKS